MQNNVIIYSYTFLLLFLTYRNLHRCKMSENPSKSKAEPQRKKRAKSTWPLHQRRNKRKSSEKDDTSEHLSPVLIITSEDESPAMDHLHHEVFQRLVKVPKKQSVSDVSVSRDTQENDESLDGTCRVLKFDTPHSAVLAEAQKPKHDLGATSTRAKLHVDFTAENGDRPAVWLDDDPCEDAFRTPTDLGSDLKISRKSRPPSQTGARKHSFRSMLAALGQRHNKIIKEAHSHQWNLGRKCRFYRSEVTNLSSHGWPASVSDMWHIFVLYKYQSLPTQMRYHTVCKIA